MFKTKITGLKETLNKIDAYSKKLGDSADKELTKSANNIANTAKTNAPVGKTGALGNSIYASTGIRFSKAVYVSAPYAAYVEFGTGSNVFKDPGGFNYSPELREYAMEFFVSGKGKMKASPYLFPAYEAEKVELIKNIRKVIIPNV